MAKRSSAAQGTADGTTTTTASEGATADAIEQRVVAFAEQLGWIVGIVEAKAEGWLDKDALNAQIASIRDGASALLDQLGGGAAKRPTKKPAPGRGRSKGRSGGVVDAPGKKHRKPMPSDPNASVAASQRAKVRSAKTMVKTNRRRGRG